MAARQACLATECHGVILTKDAEELALWVDDGGFVAQPRIRRDHIPHRQVRAGFAGQVAQAKSVFLLRIERHGALGPDDEVRPLRGGFAGLRDHPRRKRGDLVIQPTECGDNRRRPRLHRRLGRRGRWAGGRAEG